MLKVTVTIPGILLAFASPALAEANPWPTDHTMLLAQQDSGGQESVTPQDEPLSGAANTGGVTQQAREALPTMPSSDDAAGPAARGPAPMASESPPPTSGAPGRIVPPELVREIRQMALEAERNVPTPPAPTEEEIAAEQRSIEAHRKTFFANQ